MAPANNVRPPVAASAAPLDEVDVRLVELLMANGRTANNALAEQVGIAPSTCLARVRALRESGVIRGVHADVDLRALGRPLQAMISVRLQADARSRIESFEGYLVGLPDVLNVFFLVRCRRLRGARRRASADRLRDFVVNHLTAAADVAMTETSLIFDHVRRGQPR